MRITGFFSNMFVMGLMTFGLMACSDDPQAGQDDDQPIVRSDGPNTGAREALEAYLGHLEAGEFSAAEAFADDDLHFAEALAEDDDSEVGRVMLAHMSYKILDVRERGDKAEADVEVTMPNIAKIGISIAADALKNAFDDDAPEMTDDDVQQRIIDEIEDSDGDTMTTRTDMDLERVDGSWLVTDTGVSITVD